MLDQTPRDGPVVEASAVRPGVMSGIRGTTRQYGVHDLQHVSALYVPKGTITPARYELAPDNSLDIARTFLRTHMRQELLGNVFEFWAQGWRRSPPVAVMCQLSGFIDAHASEGAERFARGVLCAMATDKAKCLASTARYANRKATYYCVVDQIPLRLGLQRVDNSIREALTHLATALAAKDTIR